jgi:hypothetical protein
MWLFPGVFALIGGDGIGGDEDLQEVRVKTFAP